jgi:hypothetical protein
VTTRLHDCSRSGRALDEEVAGELIREREPDPKKLVREREIAPTGEPSTSDKRETAVDGSPVRAKKEDA